MSLTGMEKETKRLDTIKVSHLSDIATKNFKQISFLVLY